MIDYELVIVEDKDVKDMDEYFYALCDCIPFNGYLIRGRRPENGGMIDFKCPNCGKDITVCLSWNE